MIFNSTSHLRFENGVPIKGIQKCNRAIKIENSANGCNGYDGVDDDGYIVSILNQDQAHPVWGDNYQMSPKPMRLIRKDCSTVSLRGYSVLAQTPFGWTNIDLSDYGITLYAENDAMADAIEAALQNLTDGNNKLTGKGFVPYEAGKTETDFYIRNGNRFSVVWYQAGYLNYVPAVEVTPSVPEETTTEAIVTETVAAE
jgi:hypothetical protein